MDIKKHLLCIGLLLLSWHIIAQENVIPPSPESAQLHRFDTYPVSHFTGTADISIPIYTVQAGEITIPIELKYQSAGIKVEDESGSVGSGWSLIAGGRVSRAIKDKPDERATLVDRMTSSLDGNSYTYTEEELEEILDFFRSWSIDREQDFFSISTPTLSGSFILDHNTRPNFGCITIPFQAIDFSHPVEGGEPSFDYLEVTDERGIHYRFGEASDGSDSNTELIEHTFGSFYDGYNTINVPTSWLLSEVTSSDQNEKVFFEYQIRANDHFHRTPYAIDQALSITDCHPDVCDWSLGNGGCYSYEVDVTSGRPWQYNLRMLKTIQFDLGKVEFISDDEFTSRIKHIKVYEKNGGIYELIKAVELVYNDFTDPPTVPYTLDQVIFKDAQESDAYSYGLDYENEDEPFPTMFKDYHTAIDHWGYYNGMTSNSYLFPDAEFKPIFFDSNADYGAIVQVPGGNRSATNDAMHSALTDIYLPTGGRTHFDYEGNFYNGTNYSRGGGLRVKRIENYDAEGNLEYKYEYSYGINGSGNGEALLEPRDEYYISSTFSYKDWDGGGDPEIDYDHRRTTTYSPKSSIGYGYSQQPHVVYPEVTEYKIDAQGERLGSTTYSFYYHITEWSQNDIIGQFRRNMDNGGFPSVHSHFLRFYEDLGYEGKLKKKVIRNADGAIVRQEDYGYETFNEKEIHNLRVSPFFYLGEGGATGEIDIHMQKHYGTGSFWFESYPGADHDFTIPFPWEFEDSYITTGATRLTSKTVTEQGVTKTINYYYDNADHLFPTRIVEGANQEHIRYPQDFTSNGTLISLAGRNVLNIPVKKEQVYEGNIISGVFTEYNTSGKPIEIYNYESENLEPIPAHDPNINLPDNYELKWTISYDNDRAVQTEKKNDIITAYIWGYENSYPVVKIDNIDITSISSSVVSNVENHNFSNSMDPDDIQQDIDDIKGYLGSLLIDSDYRVTLYTYKPLVGMTSQTDPNGLTTYYKYDDSQRLYQIMDRDGNVLQEYKYNYKK